MRNLLYIGICIPNQRTNPLAHKLAFCTAEELSLLKISQDDIGNFLDFLSSAPFIKEMALVSTCNRFELIIFLHEQFSSDNSNFKNELALEIERKINHYIERDVRFGFLFGEEAKLQILRTYCGLNSGLVGESEISFQFNGAFKQASNLGFLKDLGLKLLDEAKKLRAFFDKNIYGKSVSYCDIAIQEAFMSLSLISPLRTATILGSGSTAVQSCLSLVNNQNFHPTNLNLIHRVSSSSMQIQMFKEIPSLNSINFIRSKKNGYRTEKVENTCLNSDLVVFGIDAKSPVLDFPDKSNLIVLDFNSNPSCKIAGSSEHRNYLPLRVLDKFVREYSYRQSNDFELLRRMNFGEEYILNELGMLRTCVAS